MAKEGQKMQSWQVFHFARKHLEKGVLCVLFGKKNARSVDYWCQNPLFTAKEDHAYDPIAGVKNLLDTLDDHGHCGVVRATISYLVAGTSCAIEAEHITEPLSSLTEEILADFRAVAILQREIELDNGIDAVNIAKRAAIAELERTVARYHKEQLP